MHLLATMPGTIADGSAAIDLAQSPGDIVLLSSADTEIALLAAAQARRRARDPQAPSPPLAPVLRLAAPVSAPPLLGRVAAAPALIAPPSRAAGRLASAGAPPRA